MYYTQDVEKIVGINSSAMRYYEKEGILPIVKRDKKEIVRIPMKI